MNIASYRGKAVLVTFLYTHCPDVCPLITSQLRVAQNLMGAATASKAQIIAVSVDPSGDTPKAVAAFLARHEMTGRMQYLVGSQHELAAAWSAWGVGSERDAQKPEFINHSGPDLRDRGLGQAHHDLRAELPALGNRPRRAPPGRSLTAAPMARAAATARPSRSWRVAAVVALAVLGLAPERVGRAVARRRRCRRNGSPGRR